MMVDKEHIQHETPFKYKLLYQNKKCDIANTEIQADSDTLGKCFEAGKKKKCLHLLY